MITTAVDSPSPVIVKSPPPNPDDYARDDYARIAEAIQFIQAHRHKQPDLATIAQHVHLSEYHFQKLFSRWAGVSPKRFLQYLTVEYAKSKLAEPRSLLDVSLEAGLSSPSRLHALFITLEAMSPGEYRAHGEGLEIRYGIHSTTFGEVLIATTSKGVCNVQFLDTATIAEAGVWLQQQWQKADVIHDSTATKAVSDRLNQSLTSPTDKPLPLLVKGTNFQVQVWRALLSLPFGSLATYQDIANHIGKPRAVRAVGTAIGVNPVAYFIPCHRVIRSNGELGGYRWGLGRKSSILGWEASQFQEIHETPTNR
ncbi:MAG: methylated-DNA--[protein]-cysteine S-methyltransferase [Cyanobacteria bacterium P01_F01_bin.86]